MNESEKQQIYQKWIERGRPWFDIDPKKEPTYAERQIIIEMKKREAKPKPQKTTAELIEEAKKLFPNTTKPVTRQTKDPTIGEFRRALGLK
jgi:hypothetical protein